MTLRTRCGIMRMVLAVSLLCAVGILRKGSAVLTSEANRRNRHMLSRRLHSEGKRRLIVSGNVVDPSQYDFFALTDSDGFDFTRDNVCGATLVHSDILITAAHCQGFFNFGVRMYDPQTGRFDRRERVVEQWRHPHFNLDNTNLNWDVLLLRLERPMRDIVPVRVNANPLVPQAGDILTAAGFGADELMGPLSDVLKDGEFQYIPPAICEELKRRYRISGAVSGDELLCANSTKTRNSICLGDSGGPLLSRDNTLVGVTSWTFRCQVDDIPDGFARVSAVHDWVQETICRMSQEKPSHCDTQVISSPPNQMVELKLEFQHDFSPEDTTFAVRNLDTNLIEYAGPKYVVTERIQSATQTSIFFLDGGRYAFEVYDKQRDGLGDTQFDANLGWWRLYARYQNGLSGFSLAASGDHEFSDKSITSFTLVAAPTNPPTNQPSVAPSSSPSVHPSEGPTTAPTAIKSDSPTVTFPPTIATSEPSARPSLAPSQRGSIHPTVSSEPIGTETLPPSHNPSLVPPAIPGQTSVEIGAPTDSDDRMAGSSNNSNGAFELAATLLLAGFVLLGLALVRKGFFLDSPNAWRLFANAFTRAPWPTSSSVSIVSRIHRTSTDEEGNSGGGDAALERSKQGKPNSSRGLGEQSTIASDSASEASASVVTRFSQVRSEMHTRCRSAWHHIREADVNHFPRFAGTQVFFSTWYQDVFRIGTIGNLPRITSDEQIAASISEESTTGNEFVRDPR